MEVKDQARLMDMLKALADESRLTLLQLLNEREYSVGDLAQAVQLGEPTVSHHLAKLRAAGFVTLRMAGSQRFYRVNKAGLVAFKRLVVDIEQLPPQPTPASDDSWIAALGWSAEDQKVLHAHTSNGRLTTIPLRNQKKQVVILRWIATLFKPDTFYTEKEVNAILKSVYEEDYVSLRRDLINFGYLRRELGGGKYWLTPADETVKE